MSVTPDRFWQIVDDTISSDQDKQCEALRKALTELSADDVLGYQLAFDEVVDRAYTWDLWGAVYVANGGASDDAFADFRYWLISRGRKTFDKVFADADSLADIVPADTEEGLGFEEFAYVAGDVWIEKTGKKLNDLTALRRNASIKRGQQTDPSGAPFEEEPAHLSKRYPKCWKRWADNPLG